MLFLHEIHEVAGACEDAFEEAFRTLVTGLAVRYYKALAG